ncbi:pyridoxamine kinase [Peptacetobacter sp.]|uniref:pyridoxamine kinase n=1 Tax=Peptacetobacter sp. TaxID=2991975 RepID=UPI002612C1FA|nr:pyridoxamine kinase [Peptacetobacter sp.]
MQKKIAAINDLSGVGKCSLSVAIPIISSLGVQCCPLPTAILSSQTGYPHFTFLDFTSEMKNYTNTWKKLNLSFDTIYSGFLGSIEQIELVKNFISENKESFIVVDPVMGDEGQIYPVFSDKIIEEIKDLIKLSDLTTPNITEACLLTNRHKDYHNLNRDDIEDIAKQISNMGPSKVVITGIHEDNNKIITNFVYDKVTGEKSFISKKYLKSSYSGTGDIFASIVSAMLTGGFEFIFSVNTAIDFVSKSIEHTSKFDISRNDGVMFEYFLKDLTVLGNKVFEKELNNY